MAHTLPPVGASQRALKQDQVSAGIAGLFNRQSRAPKPPVSESSSEMREPPEGKTTFGRLAQFYGASMPSEIPSPGESYVEDGRPIVSESRDGAKIAAGALSFMGKKK